MTKTLLVVGAALVLTISVGPRGQIAMAQQREPGEIARPLSKEPVEELKKLPVARATGKAVSKTGEKASEIAEYGMPWLAFVAQRKHMGWPAAVLTLVGGLVLLLFGWSLLRNTFEPFLAFLGCAVGAFIGLRALLSLMPEAGAGARLVSLFVAAGVGGGLYLLTALRARPFAGMLAVMTPFLLIGILLVRPGSTSTTLPVMILLAGLVLGFGSMWHLRPLAIGSTSLMGTLFLIASWGIFAHLLEIHFMLRSLVFLVEQAWVLISAVVFIGALGVNFQLTVGPATMPPHELKRPSDYAR